MGSKTLFYNICFRFILIMLLMNSTTQNESENIKNNTSLNVVLVNIGHAENCKNTVECFTKQVVQCTGEQEVLQMKLKLTPLPPLPLNLHQHQLLGLKSANSKTNSVLLNLKFDVSETQYDIRQTKSVGTEPTTEKITSLIMYHQYENYNKIWKKKFNSWQFKSIHEVYGTLGTNDSFFRGTLQFLNCGQIQLYGFIRYKQMLYQLRPHFLENKNQTADNNAHQLLNVVTDLALTDSLFTLTSYLKMKEIEEESKRRRKRWGKTKKDASIYEFCFISAIADQEFYQLLNSSPSQVVIYIKTAYMLANEIFANSKWKDEEIQNYKIGLPVVNIDLTIASELGHLTGKKVIKMLASEAHRIHYCLLHLFTGKLIKLHLNDTKGIVHGLADTSEFGGIFGMHNFGATSIYGCRNDPWKVQCLHTFSHELAHSMGALHDEKENEEENKNNLSLGETRNEHSFLMPPYSNMETPISAKNLKLSPQSVNSIEEFLTQNFNNYVSAKKWAKCGNGIVEVDEDCDEGSTSLCCDENCQFKSHARCSPYNSLCCTEKCKFKMQEKNKTKFAFACVPWNYCPDSNIFCVHKENFCTVEEIKINCEITVKTVTKTIEKPQNITNFIGIVEKVNVKNFTKSSTLVSYTTHIKISRGEIVVFVLSVTFGFVNLFLILIFFIPKWKQYCSPQNNQNNENIGIELQSTNQTINETLTNVQETNNNSEEIDNINNNNNETDALNNTNQETNNINLNKKNEKINKILILLIWSFLVINIFIYIYLLFILLKKF